MKSFFSWLKRVSKVTFAEIQIIRNEIQRIVEFYPHAADFAESLQDTLAEMQLQIVQEEGYNREKNLIFDVLWARSQELKEKDK